MSTETASESKYLAILRYLKKKYQETDDPKEKQRIGSLLDGESDTQVMSEFIAKLKTDTTKRLIGRACLGCITKHVLDLSGELKNIK
jgi:hypothetical protein